MLKCKASVLNRSAEWQHGSQDRFTGSRTLTTEGSDRHMPLRR
jgi:hypothetical protein